MTHVLRLSTACAFIHFCEIGAGGGKRFFCGQRCRGNGISGGRLNYGDDRDGARILRRAAFACAHQSAVTTDAIVTRVRTRILTRPGVSNGLTPSQRTTRKCWSISCRRGLADHQRTHENAIVTHALIAMLISETLSSPSAFDNLPTLKCTSGSQGLNNRSRTCRCISLGI